MLDMLIAGGAILSLCMAGSFRGGGVVGGGGGDGTVGARTVADLVVGGHLSGISLAGQAVLQALLQLVHMLFHVVNASSGGLHSPAVLSCKV